MNVYIYMYMYIYIYRLVCNFLHFAIETLDREKFDDLATGNCVKISLAYLRQQHAKGRQKGDAETSG